MATIYTHPLVRSLFEAEAERKRLNLDYIKGNYNLKPEMEAAEKRVKKLEKAIKNEIRMLAKQAYYGVSLLEAHEDIIRKEDT